MPPPLPHAVAAVSQVGSLPSPFEADLKEYSAGACKYIELWLGKLDTYLETHTLDDVRRLRDDLELTFPAASFQGGLLTSQGEARREHWATFDRRLEQCRTLDIPVLVLACDIVGPITQTDLDRAHVSLADAARRAGDAGLRLALEFQAGATFGNNLQTAAALVAECGRPELGICFDVFQFYRGPSKEEDLALLGSDNLFHVQLSDLPGVPREFASDSDRVLPGDGDFRLDPILDHLARIDYRGCVSVETLNPQLWQVPPRQYGEVAITSLRRLLGQASP